MDYIPCTKIYSECPTAMKRGRCASGSVAKRTGGPPVLEVAAASGGGMGLGVAAVRRAAAEAPGPAAAASGPGWVPWVSQPSVRGG